MENVDIANINIEVENLKSILLKTPGTSHVRVLSPINSNRRVLEVEIVPAKDIFRGDGKEESDDFHKYLETIRPILGKFGYRYYELGGKIFDWGFEKEIQPVKFSDWEIV